MYLVWKQKINLVVKTNLLRKKPIISLRLYESLNIMIRDGFLENLYLV